MAACFCCFRCCWNGSGFHSGHVPLKELPTVKLDTGFMGNDVVIVKNGKRICGTGAALSNAPIAQDKAYFEVKIQSTGVWGVGLATNRCNVNTVPLGNNTESWVLRHDGTLYHNNEQKGKISEIIQEGDIIFEGFYHTPPDGFDSILIEKSLL
ncbi:hypothetical protein KUTeg_012403 [Tegillarca granosa]|uniref:SPRY domain-containing protein n=1 Tax=Tegillarca granosa TaxID=220873 RepID=A0ABQ9EZF8_TEGGR|nr:hypothetical protein KUTeg_012403 [Tegillarca granosa]